MTKMTIWLCSLDDDFLCNPSVQFQAPWNLTANATTSQAAVWIPLLRQGSPPRCPQNISRTGKLASGLCILDDDLLCNPALDFPLHGTSLRRQRPAKPPYGFLRYDKGLHLFVRKIFLELRRQCVRWSLLNDFPDPRRQAN